MKSLLAAFITALVVFTLSTVWSETVQPGLNGLTSSTPKSGQQQSTRGSVPTEGSHARDDAESESHPAFDESRSGRSSPRKPIQEVATGPSVQEQERTRLEEARLAERQQTIELIYRDIFREIEALKEIRRRSTIELAAAEKRATESISVQTSGSTTTQQPAAQSSKPKSTKGAAERRMAVLVQGLVDRGNPRAAAALLAGLKEREASKVLSLLKDSQTATQLADQLRTVAANPSEQH